MIKKIFLPIIFFLFILPLSVKAELSKETMDSISHFLIMDFMTAKSSENNKPLTNIFYIKETGEVFQISEEEIESVGLKGLMTPGEYKRIEIINEVSGLGVLLRNASINKDNQIIWDDMTYSLMHFLFKPMMGNMRQGVRQVMTIYSADVISDLFKGCQRGEIPVDWKPSEAELDFYTKTIDIYYTVMMRR